MGRGRKRLKTRPDGSRRKARLMQRCGQEGGKGGRALQPGGTIRAQSSVSRLLWICLSLMGGLPKRENALSMQRRPGVALLFPARPAFPKKADCCGWPWQTL